MSRYVPAYPDKPLDCVVVLHLVALAAGRHGISKLDSRDRVIDAVYPIEAVCVEPGLSTTKEAWTRHHPLSLTVLQEPRHLGKDRSML